MVLADAVVRSRRFHAVGSRQMREHTAVLSLTEYRDGTGFFVARTG
jgi:hypothetical protein